MDTSIALYIHNLFPYDGNMLTFMRDVSFLGSAFFMSIVVIISTLYLLFKGRFHKAHIILLAGILAGVASSITKVIFKRLRPTLWEEINSASGYSFPSGHAIVTSLVYGLIAYFLAEHYPNKKKTIWSFYFILVFLVGFSRVYLGVHWPSDIIGGWAVGALLFAALYWWYKKGGITRAIRWAFGFGALLLGVIGLILPIIPGIPLLIAGFLLIFSDKKIADMFKKKQEQA